ncbi:MAG: ABC transporter ATP-binding protein [Xanthomonadales bacterium]|nr:ABC transporter ATP-binding protein [Xanthomonadales bacterium]
MQVRGLCKRFAQRRGLFSAELPALTAVDSVSLTIPRGAIYGLVGESGAGKSTLARCILQLLKPDRGEVLLHGRDLCRADATELRAARRKLQVIFQDPLAALSPRRTVRQSLLEPLEQFAPERKAEWEQRCLEALEQVDLDRELLPRLPRQLSSGQRQRVCIARALVSRPDLIIADEAVSALDVSVQAHILELVRALRDRHGIAFLFISHDLGVIAQVADQVGIMFGGRIVESGTREAVFGSPAHPYTRELLSAVPDPDPEVPFRPLRTGAIGSGATGDGCIFAQRCPEVMDRCRRMKPPDFLLDSDSQHRVECLLHEPVSRS